MEEFLDPMEALCREETDAHREKYGQLPLGNSLTRIDGGKASREDVEAATDELCDFYDNLLGINSSNIREELKQNIVYNSKPGELAKKFSRRLHSKPLKEKEPGGKVFPGTSTMFYGLKEFQSGRLNGTYSNGLKAIGVSKDRISKGQAYDTLAAELFHALQYSSGSWTKDSNTFCEGLERAVRVKALEHLHEKRYDGIDGWKLKHEVLKRQTLLTGYTQLKRDAENMFTTKNHFSNDWLTEDEIESLVKYSIENSKECREYNIGASVMMTFEEKLGETVYSEAFHGEPVKSKIDISTS